MESTPSTVTQWIDTIASNLNPLVVYSLFIRAIGLCLFVALAPQLSQVSAFFGPKGLLPVSFKFTRIKEDFPTWRRFLMFPSLWWLGTSAAFLQGSVLVASICAVIIMYGAGEYTPVAMLLCLAIYVSLDEWTPWDNLLLETCYLVLWLPAPPPIHQQLALHQLPSPTVAFALRWLLFRLMVGFGKLKFVGSSWQDRCYVRDFFISMPMPTYAAWFAHKLPRWFHAQSLIFFYLVRAKMQVACCSTEYRMLFKCLRPALLPSHKRLCCLVHGRLRSQSHSCSSSVARHD